MTEREHCLECIDGAVPNPEYNTIEACDACRRFTSVDEYETPDDTLAFEHVWNVYKAKCGADATSAGAAGVTSRYSGEAYYAIDYVPDGEPVPWLFFILVYAYIAIIALACYL